MKNNRTIAKVEAEYLRNHPEEIDEYIMVLLMSMQRMQDGAALLSSLRVVCRVKGVTAMQKLRV